MTRRNASKAGAPPCGLFLRIRDDGDAQRQFRDLRAFFHVLNASDYEKNLHAVAMLGPRGPTGDPERYAAFAALCKLNGIVFMTGNLRLAGHADADGVVIDSAGDVAVAREMMGKDGIVAVDCGTARSKADAARTNGADAVLLGSEAALPPATLIAEWSTTSDIPCIVEGPMTNDLAGEYVRAGADLLDVTDYVLSHEEGVMKGTVNMLYAIDLALERRRQ
ncbi:MAG: thiamine phosphate synthase [Alphaproteobacteria bacterium]|nr:thiamine phosphate synthase [Alphaproteobacteria bacterium]